ncbi:hypothetical protein [Terrisporobacter hibernicus]|uniref:Membrane fusion protein n=1 Tax=Terrisporobacter hibernicus TaxID=2813371 RepID=A0AAX2ZNS4_9FIRM|nr:hypothetical protein [Terrisporobacter hibernicus]UEL49252.1 hypothetical protein JW646_07360 [Terrisporobacter hibernicus]
MKVKLSKIILIISVVGTIIVGISLANIYQTDIVVKDVHGKRSALGDMNILLQKTGGVFQTDEIIINKNSTTTKKLVKQRDTLFNLTKENLDNRDLFQFQYDKNILFEDKNTVGTAEISGCEVAGNKQRMMAYIETKDKKNNKIESYKIDMGEDIDTNENYTYASIPVKKEGDILYVATMYSYGDVSDDSSDEEYVDDSTLADPCYKITNLSLYKLNLSNKTSKCIVSKDYEGKDLSIKQSGFSNGNKAYFIVNKKNNKSDDYSTNLFELDINLKEVNLIDLKTKDDYIETSYNIENDEILLLSMPSIDEMNSEISENVDGILVNLKDRDLKYKYKLDINYNVDFTSGDRVRRDNGKIYVASATYVKTDKYENNYQTPYNFYVFDEKDGEMLYEGSTTINSSDKVNMGIVKNDEI